MWARVLESKYEGWRGLSEVTRGKGESVWWWDLKIVFNHPQHGAIMNTTTLWRVGCGDKFKFWEDRWMGGRGFVTCKIP